MGHAHQISMGRSTHRGLKDRRRDVSKNATPSSAEAQTTVGLEMSGKPEAILKAAIGRNMVPRTTVARAARRGGSAMNRARATKGHPIMAIRTVALYGMLGRRGAFPPAGRTGSGIEGNHTARAAMKPSRSSPGGRS